MAESSSAAEAMGCNGSKKPAPFASDRTVYVVVGQRRRVNEKIRKVLSLRPEFANMVLVSPGARAPEGVDNIVRPTRSPTQPLQWLGFTKTKRQLDRYLFFPSAAVLYIQKIRPVLRRRIRDELSEGKQVTLVTSAPPHDICLVGLSLKREFPDIYWVVDWRDLWSHDENYRLRVPRLYRRRLRRLEREIQSSCDMNVTTNRYAKAVLTQGDGVPERRVTYVNQHFCPEDLPEEQRPPPRRAGTRECRKLTIGFMGTMFKPPRVPGLTAVDAVDFVRRAGVGLELHIYGRVPEHITRQANELEQRGVTLCERLPHSECLRRLAEYDFLLLVLGDQPSCKAVMSLKLPHYLLIGRPILAIVPADSATAEVVRETGAGHVIDSASHWGEGLLQVLKEEKGAVSQPLRDEKAIQRYSWEHSRLRWLRILHGQQSACESA